MTALLELRGAVKRYGATTALAGVDFDLKRGEVHALVGENGAGKSTALGLMYGVISPNEGELAIDGKVVQLSSIAHAQALGVSCVFQELSLAEGLSVAENIFAGRPPTRAGLIDWARLRAEARTLLDDFEIEVDVRAPVGSLPVGARQVVEIAKALSLKAQVLLLDEPTSALSPDEKRALFRLVRRLTARGMGIVYVSHHLPEVLEIADRITVFRDGRKISCHQAKDTSEEEIVREMVGSAVDRAQTAKRAALGDVLISMQGVSAGRKLRDLSLDMHAGEVLGIAGLLGSGAATIGELLAGLERPTAGQISLAGAPFAPRSFRVAKRAGIAFVPQERKTEGLFIDVSLRGNVVAASLGRHTRAGLFGEASASRAARKAISAFSIKTDGDSRPVSSLSGGNQQKVMIAKWFETDPRLLIVNEPTKGVDIGAKQQIHTALREAAAEGRCVLVVSSDFPELISLCDRIAVIRQGALQGVLERPSEAELVDLASGPGKATKERDVA